MKLAGLARMAAVAGVMVAGLLSQVPAAASETFTLGYTKVVWQAVDAQTEFGADYTVVEGGAATGVVKLHKFNNVTLKRGLIEARTGTVRCERSGPVLVMEGTYFEEIEGKLVAQGPGRAEARRPVGGGGDIIIFDIVDSAAQRSTVEARGQLAFNAGACR